MSISTVTTSSMSAGLGLISGTSSYNTMDVNAVLAQGQGSDTAEVSKGGQLMSKLQQLQSSDPEKFKEVAQKISDQLTEQSQNTSDSDQAAFYSDWASKFAGAATSGSMESLRPGDPPSQQAGTSAAGKLQMKFAGQKDPSEMFSTMDSIISDALSGVSSTSA